MSQACLERDTETARSRGFSVWIDEAAQGSKIVTIVQARSGSKRLPQKVLLKISGRSMLEIVVDRAGEIGYPVLLAIPDSDQTLVRYCRDHGWNYFSGSEIDVLGRIFHAAHHTMATDVIRITADCPLLDIWVVQEAVSRHLATGADFTHYVAEGRGAEIFKFSALATAHFGASSVFHREHPDEYILENPHLFRIEEMKFSVDTLDDLRRIRRIYDDLQHEVQRA